MTGVPLIRLKGIGQKRAALFAAQGISCTDDLLSFLPRTYQDYSVFTPVLALQSGKNAAVRVRILDDPKVARFRGMTVVSVRTCDETGSLHIKWFNQPYRRTQLAAGQTVILCGRADLKKGRTLLNPSIHETLPGFVPIYPTLEGLPQRTVRDAVKQALLLAKENGISETLPHWMLERFDLSHLEEAYRNAHFPVEEEALARAIRRLSFENALCYLLAVESERAERKRIAGVSFSCEGVLEQLAAKLPFPLTKAQERAIREIAYDLKQPCPMNRLLQGDVGSGKTVVAAFMLLAAVNDGYQGALLAPTEVLAKQHYDTFNEWFPGDVCLLTGAMPQKIRNHTLARIADGTAKIVIGTHALLQQDVAFHRLGVVCTDEQHRFGVLQRAAIAAKGVRPDVLVMSATPIPRTLALLLYGDLEVSILDEMPPNRIPIKTSFIAQSKRLDMYRYIEHRAEEGVQTYVVCPVIEDSDETETLSVEAVYLELKETLGIAVGLLHGKMRSKEKDDVIGRFRTGEVKVLVSTTVIEVGVHVPNANIIVIESADRFGLAQLHQLRGRVGRGSEQAYCFLLANDPGEAALDRLRVLTKTNDGFEIAEKDLALRGYGDLLGTRQHGEAEMAFLSAIKNVQLLKQAQDAAHEVLQTPSAENNALLVLASKKYISHSVSIAMN